MAKYVNIKDLVIGDTIKINYKDEDSDANKMYSRLLTVASINLAEKSVTTLDGRTVYGGYAHNEYFNLNN